MESITKVVAGYKVVDSFHPAIFLVNVRLDDVDFGCSLDEVGKLDVVYVTRVCCCCLLRDLEIALIDCFMFGFWLDCWVLYYLARRLLI